MKDQRTYESLEEFYLWHDGDDMSNVEDDDKSDEGEENDEAEWAGVSDVVGDEGMLSEAFKEQEWADVSDAVGNECMRSEGESKDYVSDDTSDADSDDGFIEDFVKEVVREERELYERFCKTCREVLRCVCMR
mmetsp:Transcript_92771/g.267872  ORF Transcript_92771/g.267872 Transcript_92771/m.267872 type:complete len:133 (-) Transcript_92771:109-507(-)